MNWKSWFAIIGWAAATVCLSYPAQSRELTVVGFGGASQDALRKVYFEPFSNQTGIKVIEDTYNGSLAKIQTMVTSGNVIWDVVDFSGSGIARACQSGLVELIDWSQVGDKSKFVPAAVSDCGVGLDAWAMVLAYNADTLADGPKNWADFFDVERFPGKRGLRRQARSTLEIALLADGVAPKDVYDVLGTKAGVDRAFRKLDSIKEHIQWWEAGAQPPEWLAAGDVAMSAAYNGRIANANGSETNLRIVWDGQITYWTYWGIVKGSPYKDEAMKMIAFMSQPEQMKHLPEYIPYGLPRKDASAMLPESVAQDLPTHPSNMINSLIADDTFWLRHQADLSARFNSWLAR